MKKLALGIEYNGSAYAGWQSQHKMNTVQKCLENAISIIANETITVICAGRTDAGVHATGQIVHFSTKSQRPDAAWTIGVNSCLPPDIAIQWMVPVPNHFHARFSAITRRYRYLIYNHHLRPALLHFGLTHYRYPLNVSIMQQAGQCLIGENDFSSFRALKCFSKSPWRNVYHLYVTRQKNYVIIDIKANSFVQKMVRNIVGSLLEVGCGNRSKEWFIELLACRDRTKAGCTAPAKGLYLVEVNYPFYFSLPQSKIGPLFLKT
ncbi:tRNA pseudouridine(38-40) synthase TruA [Sodalis sp. CWE]|uniref:tRNA pseudouridine(38-40) synthase TruA n=1 Tax=Sodalis sp. CWE TaxID=2803816 RepID=UPI001C7D25EC|nr:tRNA pseudouridine(38-40) synthase TruA [Sodalis sp. CWE]MBX4181086.1 tRNA pseudouridine(38-40) synthase TruA [Sodalis sp. CWE]